MFNAGIAIFEKRTEYCSRLYTYEKKDGTLSKEFETQFKANKRAWEYFQNFAPSYRKISIKWIISAKIEVTRVERLEKIIEESQAETTRWKENKYVKK